MHYKSFDLFCGPQHSPGTHARLVVWKLMRSSSAKTRAQVTLRCVQTHGNHSTLPVLQVVSGSVPWPFSHYKFILQKLNNPCESSLSPLNFVYKLWLFLDLTNTTLYPLLPPLHCIQNAAAHLVHNLLKFFHLTLSVEVNRLSPYSSKNTFSTRLCIPGIKRLCALSVHPGSRLHTCMPTQVFRAHDTSFPEILTSSCRKTVCTFSYGTWKGL